LPIELDCATRAPNARVGVDLGLKHLATLSTGQTIAAPQFYRAGEHKLATAQRARKTAKRVRALHAKAANRRKDFLHKESTKLTTQYGLIVIGDTSPATLAKTRLAKSVLDAGWADLRRMLSYKAMMHGGGTLEVSEAYTTQICSCCGSLPKGRPKGSADLRIREWTCGACGAHHDRDVNAARNILRLGLQSLAGGAHV
jgi:IS605 OrfB family transposase